MSKQSTINTPVNATVRTFKAKAVLIRAGQRPDQVFEILTGAVLLRKRFSSRHQATLDLLGKGSLVGLLSVVGKNPYPFDIVALTRVSAKRYSRDHIDWLLKNKPDFARRAFRQMGSLLDRNDQTRRIVIYPLPIRIAYFLRHLKDALGPSASIKRKDMTEIMEIPASELERSLNDLAEKGLVKCRAGKVSVRSSRLFKMLDGLPVAF